MGNKPPVTIVTDQDEAIAKAIEIVFPSSRHHLCVWHISTNAPSHLSSISTNKHLYGLFKNCLFTCESEEEFDKSWNGLMEHVPLDSISWLEMMHKIREKWSPAFTRRDFSGRIKASQRSESANRVLNGLASATTNLTQFAIAYQDLVRGMRSTELEDDFRCKQEAPVMAIKNSGILKHAAKIYTYKLYKLFEIEFMNSLAMTWEETSTDGELLIFQLKEENSERVRTVKFNSVTNEVACSCRLFEWLGILCRHTLRVINLKNLTAIPDRYILNRWTKHAKQGINEHVQAGTTLKTCNETEAVFRNSMMRLAYNLITRSQENPVTREICRSKLLECESQIESEFAKSATEKEQVNNSNEALGNADEPPIRDPKRKRRKGDGNDRIKFHFEKKQKKTATRKTKREKKSTQVADQGKQNNSSQVNVYPSQLLVPGNQIMHPMQISAMSYGNLLMQMSYQGYATHNVQADNPTTVPVFFNQASGIPSLSNATS